MTLTLPPLPYDYDALEPYISSATLKLHHGVHHRGYLERASTLVRGTGLENRPLEDIVVRNYQARRGDYLTAVLDHLLDWSFAERNLRERSNEAHA